MASQRSPLHRLPQKIRRASLLALLVLPAVGLLELVTLACGALKPSHSSADLDKGRAALASAASSGVLVVGAPPSLAAEAVALLDPAARNPVWVEPSSFAQAVEVSLDGSRSPELKGWDLLDEKRVGSTRIRSVRNPARIPIRYDLVGAFGGPSVTASTGRAGSPWGACQAANAEADLPAYSPVPWAPKQRVTCASDPMAFVGVVTFEGRDAIARRCLWTYPGPNVYRVSFAGVPASARVVAAVAVGAAKPQSGASKVVVRFKVNGAPILEQSLTGQTGFDSFEAASQLLAQGGEVALEVEQQGKGLAPVCVEASLR